MKLETAAGDALAGYIPDHPMSRFLPVASTTRWIVGVSSEVAQFSGTGNRGLQVRPASVLRLSWIAPLP